MSKKYFASYIKIFLLITALGLIIYSNSLGNQFVWDDKTIITDNYLIRSWQYLPKLFATSLYHFVPLSQINYYRPLQSLSYMIDYSLWQLNPFGYHLTNLLLHIFNAFLAFLLVKRISNSKRIALLTSLLFIVHPVHTEAVSYISGRADLIVGFFLLLSFTFFIEYTCCPLPKKNLYYTGSIIAFIAALLSKESALIFPALLMTYDHCFPSQDMSRSFAHRLKRRYLSFLIIAALYIVLRVTVLNFSDKLIPLASGSLNVYLRTLTLCKSLTAYAGLLLMPLNLHMERSFPAAGSFFELPVLGAVVLVFAVGTAVWIYRSRERPIYFGLLWFLLTLVLQSSLIFPEITAEHFLYLPAIGIFLIFAYLSFKRLAQSKLIRSIFVSFLVFYAILTWGQNLIWKDPLTFYYWTLKHSPDSIKVHNNLGNIYQEKGLYEQATVEYLSALNINPEYVNAHIGLGNVYLKKGLYRMAILEYEQALKSKPDSLLIKENIILACDQAMAETQDAASPNAPLSKSTIMQICDTGIDAYKKELQTNPNSDILHYNLGVLYSRKGLMTEALTEYQKAISLNPKFSKAYYNSGAIYAGQGRLEKAIQMWERCLEVEPEFEKARLAIKRSKQIYSGSD